MPIGIYVRVRKDYGQRICLICNKEFPKRDNEKPFLFRKRKCCSRQCNAKLSQFIYMKKRNYIPDHIEISCIYCGKKEDAVRSKAKRKFCGRNCMGKWMSENRIGENSTRWQGGKVKRYCLVCEKEFEFDKGEIKRSEGSRLFCSRSCQGKSRVGEKNGNWHGGITPEIHRIRGCIEAKIWKKDCLHRDNHECQNCGEIENLHIHHLKSFKSHPELRFDIKNGITLCANCHHEIHSLFRRNAEEKVDSD